MLLVIINNKKMKVIGENDSNEQKLLEEKRENMNKLIGLNNISIKEDITLLISDWCAEHIKTLHKEYPHEEWLAYCKVEPQWNWVFLMTDMVFPWQRTTSWDVETTKEWMEWLNSELIRRWERATDWNCVLHSHHNMGVFWSGTDDNARLSLNDWRKLARAVVTAYDKDGNVDYKGCINFYKPYNIEIDINVRDENEITIIDRYKEYQEMVLKKKVDYYDNLLEANKGLVDELTEKPDYWAIVNYLWIDITEELTENYSTIREKVWNPELLEYLKQLEEQAKELAENEINISWKYNDMLTEYGAFCSWSDNLLTQLEENKKQTTYASSISSISNQSLFSTATAPSNRDFEDEYYDGYYFNSYEYDEYYTRQCLWIKDYVPMKVGSCWEWLAWSNKSWRYMYVEDWAEEFWG